MARTYKIRKFVNGRGAKGQSYTNYSLTVPTEIAERLPEDIQYACTLDETGIHFAPVTSGSAAIETPSWAKPQNGGGKPQRTGRARPGEKAKT